MNIRALFAVAALTLVVAATAAAAVTQPAADAAACFRMSGFANVRVETYGSMTTELDVSWGAAGSLDAWLMPSNASARALYARTHAAARDPELTRLSGRWVYTWSKWPAPMAASAAHRCLSV